MIKPLFWVLKGWGGIEVGKGFIWSYKAGIVFAKFEGMELLKSYLRNIHNLIKLEF